LGISSGGHVLRYFVGLEERKRDTTFISELDTFHVCFKIVIEGEWFTHF